MTARALLLAGGPGGPAPLPDIVNVVTVSGAGSIVIPEGYTAYTAEAIGSGGLGFGSTTTNQRAGGGGGQYAISNARIAVTPGNSIFYSVGAAGGGNDSWVNTTNAVPTSATTGCRARGGTNGAGGTAGVGSTAGGVGATVRNGSNGTTGASGRGGAGSGATTAASGQTGGTDTTGLSPATPMGGGSGGSSGGGVGVAPGGAGGGRTTAGTVAGSVGRIRIVFYES